MYASVTAAQMREIDRLMVEELGVTLLQMMELAGRSVAELARRMLSGGLEGADIAVLAGPGNNGGGGLSAARHLVNAGASVSVILARPAAALKPAPAHHLETLRRMRTSVIDFTDMHQLIECLREADIIVDALLGYGARGSPRESIAALINFANESRRPILSIDMPSGLNPDDGVPGTPCVRATETLSLGLPKRGLQAATARPYVGRLWVGDIGIPSSLYSRVGAVVGPIFSLGSLTSAA